MGYPTIRAKAQGQGSSSVGTTNSPFSRPHPEARSLLRKAEEPVADVTTPARTPVRDIHPSGGAGIGREKSRSAHLPSSPRIQASARAALEGRAGSG
jgi:hypothetical protein